MALEELGVTFVKLGQVLSARTDLLPPAYQMELAKLQDQVAPLPVGTVRQVLASELGRPVERAFATFDRVPLAAASIGQVHAATLADGRAVVVKVRRPGVVEQVEADLAILHDLAATGHRWAFGQEYDVVGLYQEFAETLRAELDYEREARNAERFAANFAGADGVHIPRVYWETTTPRVLTLERIRGSKINDSAALAAAGIDRPALAARAARLALPMVFEHGFFHADPHPGNFFVEPDGRIGLVDFGMVGTVDEATQEQLARVLLAVAGQDSGRLADTVLELGAASERVDRERLRRDLEHVVARYYGRPLSEIALGPLLEEGFGIIRRHHLHLPPKLALLLKTVVMYEGLGAQVDPDFRLTPLLESYAERLLLRQYSPVRWGRQLVRVGLDAARLGVEGPEQLRRILGNLERGTVEVGVRPEHVEPLLRRLERLVNRLVLGILAAAFINGLAVLLAAYRSPGVERWIGLLIAFGLLVAAALGAYLAWAIARSGPDWLGPAGGAAMR